MFYNSAKLKPKRQAAATHSKKLILYPLHVLQLSQTEAKAAGLVIGPRARPELQRLDVAVDERGLWRKSHTGWQSVRKSHTRTRMPFVPVHRTDHACI